MSVLSSEALQRWGPIGLALAALILQGGVVLGRIGAVEQRLDAHQEVLYHRGVLALVREELDRSNIVNEQRFVEIIRRLDRLDVRLDNGE